MLGEEHDDFLALDEDWHIRYLVQVFADPPSRNDHLPLRVWAITGRGILLFETLLVLAPLFGFYAILAILAGRFDAEMRTGAVAGTLGFAFRSFLALSFLPVLAHRVIPKSGYGGASDEAEQVLREILAEVPVPV